MVLAIVDILVGLALNVVISGVLAYASWAWAEHEAHKAREVERRGKLGDTYSFDLMQNSTKSGTKKAVIVGKHRFAGHIIEEHTRTSGIEGIDELNTVIGLGWGVLSAINPNGDSDLHIDGNLSTNFRNVDIESRTGTIDQLPIQGMDQSVVTTAHNTQLLNGFSGGSGNWITLTGTADADSFRIKITLVSGLYEQSDDTGKRRDTTLGIWYRVRTTAGPGAWGAWTRFEPIRHRRYEQFSLWFGADFLSGNDTYDVQLKKETANSGDRGLTCDPYIKEYQQVTDTAFKFPNTAVVGVKSLSSSQLSGAPPRYTFLVEGCVMNGMTSASTFGAPAYSNNPAEIIALLIHNSNYGAAIELKPRLELTLNTVSGAFDVGEVVKGPYVDPFCQFKGIVRAYSGTTMTVQATQGLPYISGGTDLTGQTSGETARVTSIDRDMALDLDDLWEFHEFCDEQVPDGGAVTTVDGTSSGKVLPIVSTATPAFAPGDFFVVDYGGDREESGEVDTVQAGVSITAVDSLAYVHTLAQADKVSIAENRAEFDFVFQGDDDLWSALGRICRCSRAEIHTIGSTIHIRAKRASAPSELVCEGNINVNSVKMHDPPDADLPNIMRIAFRNQDLDYRKDVATYQDPDADANLEPRLPDEQEYYGITRLSQANREIAHQLKRNRYRGVTFQFEMGIDSLGMRCSDVFRFCHRDWGFGVGGGQAKSSTNNTIMLDHDLTVAGSEKIRIRHLDGTEEEQIVVGGAGTFRQLEIVGTWTVNPAEGTLYAVGNLGRFRVLSIAPTQDGMARILAEEDAVEFYDDDYGIKPTFTENTLINPNEIPPDVTDLTLDAIPVVEADAHVDHYIDVSFNKPEWKGFLSFEIWVRSLSSRQLWIGSSQYVRSSTSGEFDRPMGVCSDDIYLYVADTGNNRIGKFYKDTLAWVANLGSVGTGNGELDQPTGVSTNGTHIWITDAGNNRVQKWTIAGVYVAKIGTYGTGSSQFKRPFGITHDPDNNDVYVADTFNNRIAQMDDDLSGTGWAVFGSQGDTDGKFERPMGVTIYLGGPLLYVADTGNNRLQRLETAPMAYSSKIGTQGDGDDQFESPMDVAFDEDNEILYVADTRNHRFHLRDAALNFGSAIGDYGLGRDQFEHPQGICHDGDRNIFLTEWESNRVTKRHEDELGDAGWERAGITNDSRYTVRNGLAWGEKYEISVVPVSQTGMKKDPEDGVTDSVITTRRSTAPPDVTGLRAINITSDQVVLNWDYVYFPDLQSFMVMAGPSWRLGRLVTLSPIGVRGTWEHGFQATATISARQGATLKYHVKAISKSGTESDSAATVTVDIPGGADRPSGWSYSYP